MQLYAHPFSSYCQKVLIALYENRTPFGYREIGPDDPETREAWAKLSPVKRMPVLVDGERTVLESSTIIEYLDWKHPGAVKLIPADPDHALEARMLDRVFDNYVMTPMQTIVFHFIRDEADRDPYGVTKARALLDTAYGWLDEKLAGRQWAAGDFFSLADCAAAPALFYADWVHEIPVRLTHLKAFRARLLARSSFARAIDEARPYRKYFPPGAPDRD